MLSCVWLFVTPRTAAHQAPLSPEFYRQEYWSGLPFPSPGDLPKLGIEPRSPVLQADSWPSEPNPVDCKEIKPVNPKGTWLFIGRTDAKTEAPILWPTNAKSQLISKDPDAGKDWRQEEEGTIENEMVEWHHRLNGHDFEQTPGDSEGQGSLACCSLWGFRVVHDWVSEQQHMYVDV